jgi:L-glyceraldehyde 3-phosphate reductase
VQRRRLGPDLEVSALGLGCMTMSGTYGHDFDDRESRATLLRAVDLGVTFFDTADVYGPFANEAVLGHGLAAVRDQVVLATKFGFIRDSDGANHGVSGRPDYVRRSCDLSLQRLGTDHIDLYWQHRVDPVTPIEETIGALDTLVRQGKALYVGISSYSAERTATAAAVARSLGTPLVIHQPAYSILNRWVEDGLTGVLKQEGMGAIAFTPLAQGLLTDKYLGDGPADRAQNRSSLPDRQLSEGGLAALRGLNVIAKERGQTLAQMAIQWILRDPVVTSALIGASRPAQLDENVAALTGPAFDTEELEQIDALSGRLDVDLWAESAQL